MKKTVSATEARVHFGELLRGVAEEDETYIVERSGKPTAVLVSFEEYQETQKHKPKERWEILLEESQRIFRESGAEVPDAVKLINEGRQERDDATLGDLLRREPDRQAGTKE
jgi:prevent-host-death family protein